jgi:sugar lactone lactonase YvrE
LITRNNQLLITDTGNKRVQVFDTEGNFVAQFGKSGAGPGEFSEPVGLAEDPEGNIYVADTWNKRVQVWSKDFQYVRSFAVQAWETMDPNVLTSIDHKPYLAASVDTLYVSSPRTGQVLGYSFSGELKDLAGVSFAADDLPTGVEVSGNTLFVTNVKNASIVEFPIQGGPQ